jgi:hypothetical protein
MKLKSKCNSCKSIVGISSQKVGTVGGRSGGGCRVRGAEDDTFLFGKGAFSE